MFKCGACKRQTNKGEKATVQYRYTARPVTHPYREKAHGKDSFGKDIADPGGEGYQIAEQRLVGSCCKPAAEPESDET